MKQSTTPTDVGTKPKKAMTSPVKRAKKAAPRGKWSEATLLTSEKSVLVHADLVVCYCFRLWLFLLPYFYTISLCETNSTLPPWDLYLESTRQP